MQKIIISLDIFAEEKSFLNWPENLPFFFWTEDTWDTLYTQYRREYPYEYARRKDQIISYSDL